MLSVFNVFAFKEAAMSKLAASETATYNAHQVQFNLFVLSCHSLKTENGSFDLVI